MTPKLRALLEKHRKGIEEAAEYALGQYTFDDVVSSVEAGLLVPVEFPNSLLLIQQTSSTQLHIAIATGRMDEMVPAVSAVIRTGKAKGLSNVTIAGRRGWLRVMEPVGMKEVGIIMSATCQ